MNKLAWLEAEARQFFHLINIAVVIDLINSYHFLSNETKLKLGFAYFKYVWDMLPERECLWLGISFYCPSHMNFF